MSALEGWLWENDFWTDRLKKQNRHEIIFIENLFSIFSNFILSQHSPCPTCSNTFVSGSLFLYMSFLILIVFPLVRFRRTVRES